MSLKQVEPLVKLRDALAMAAEALNEYIETFAPAGEKPAWDPSRIKWEQKEGTRGPYERSEDVNSPDHKALLKDIAEHKGFLFRDGWNYWTFKNGWVIGRKRKEA